MTATERFQKRFGGKWNAIVNDPAFQEAMVLANVSAIKVIGSLTPEQIKEHGVPILAGLAGRLAHEEELIRLSVVEPKGVNDIEATYPNPEDELTEQVNGKQNGNDETFLASFQASNVPHETSIPDQQKLTTKQKRQAAAAKARAAKQAKYKARLKNRLSNSPRK